MVAATDIFNVDKSKEHTAQGPRQELHGRNHREPAVPAPKLALPFKPLSYWET